MRQIWKLQNIWTIQIGNEQFAAVRHIGITLCISS